MAIKIRSGAFLAPFHPMDEDPTLCLRKNMELIEYLDQIGFDEAWVGEHHSGGVEIIGSPELFLAGAAERTRRIRLGTGVVSVPYHNPYHVANRILQLDHQTQGRLIFGMGPGLLPWDAAMIGIDPASTRERFIEAADVIVRLLRGERVTRKTDWFELVDAYCQLRPHAIDRLDISVASTFTPSGGRLAGTYGFGMLCLAATKPGAYDALADNWRIANEVAEENGQVMDRNNLRLASFAHIAETREKAFQNIETGFAKWQHYTQSISGLPGRDGMGKGSVREQAENGEIIVGSPEDAIAVVRRLQAKQGEFGCFLMMDGNWADFEATKKSYELWQRYVSPAINEANTQRTASLDWIVGTKAEMLSRADEGRNRAFKRHEEAQQRSSDAVRAAE